jgi:DNA-binding response OmpR family regulator
LPATTVHQPTRDSSSKAGQSGRRAAPASSILIVEDDPTLRETLAHALGSHGYVVETQADAGELAARVAATSPDLVILDVMLPGIDGFTACRSMRAAGSTVPVLMLSARSGDVDKIVGLESGADDYVTKPFSTGELLARVRALLRRTPAARGTTLTFGDLELDLIGRRVLKAAEELHLTNKEFSLLAELMRNPGVVLSRDLLLEKIWGYDYFGDSRTVDVHIRWLRQKIEDDPSAPSHITTVRGVGYRFDG